MSENQPARSSNWHAMTEQQVLQQTYSSEQGLSSSEIPPRLAQYGRNAMEATESTSALTVVLHQLHNPLIYLLMGAAAVSLAIGHWIDSLVIMLVVVLNTVLGAVQEWKADRALDALQRMAAPHARVLRNGNEIEVLAEEIVPGDVLLLETGARVAADARVLQATELHADESALTGESEAVSKSPGLTDADTPLADMRNMVWMSTAITAGRGRAVVVGTAMDTVLGRIAGQVRETKREQTPLQQRLASLSTWLGVAGIALALVVFGLGLLRSYEFWPMLMFAVAVAVSAIPEGLPAVISVTLALGVQRMARRNAVIRRLPAVETLGSTTVICSDKTGTITRNEMTVTALWSVSETSVVTGSGFEPAGQIHPKGKPGDAGQLADDIRLLLRIGVLANNAGLVQHEQNWKIQGSATEGAMLVAARKSGIVPSKLEAEYPRLSEVPFSSSQKYMATLHQVPGQSHTMACVKGAPDRIINFCTHVMDHGRRVELTAELRAKIEQANNNFAADALRVVAGAVRDFPAGQTNIDSAEVESGLTFVGLWGLVDPPRPEAIKAIADAQGAGIRIVMITGDHAVTAGAIARQVGIIGGPDDPASIAEAVTTGAELDELDEDGLARRVLESSVYARVTPSHKLRILQALKSHDQVVAMTGDGVNDAPALKGADIGVAMGQTGTEVAKEAADMVLTDDDFATIVHAVEEGRVIFSNLRRVVFFLITTNLGEILTLTGALILNLPLPLTAVMILWINLVTDGACTVPLGVEPRHWDVLKQRPRPPGTGVIDKYVLRRMLMLAPLMAIGTLGLYVYELEIGSAAHAQTMAFTTLAAFQWFHALNARSSYVSVFSVGFFTNKWLWVGIISAIILQVLTVHTEIGRTVFRTEVLNFSDWLLVSAVGSSILIIDEILKRLHVHGRLPVGR